MIEKVIEQKIDNNFDIIFRIQMEDISINYSFDFYESCISKFGHSILICLRLHFSAWSDLVTLTNQIHFAVNILWWMECFSIYIVYLIWCCVPIYTFPKCCWLQFSHCIGHNCSTLLISKWHVSINSSWFRIYRGMCTVHWKTCLYVT